MCWACEGGRGEGCTPPQAGGGDGEKVEAVWVGALLSVLSVLAREAKVERIGVGGGVGVGVGGRAELGGVGGGRRWACSLWAMLSSRRLSLSAFSKAARKFPISSS